MGVEMDYTDEFLRHIAQSKIKSFTHRDILEFTAANCSYNIIRALRARLEDEGKTLNELWEYRVNSRGQRRKFKRYWIEA